MCSTRAPSKPNATLLYALHEVLGGTPVAGVQLDHPTEDELVAWLQPY